MSADTHCTGHLSSLASLVLAAALSLAPPLVQAGSVLDRIKATGTLTLAHREDVVPFSYLDDRGQPVGYAIDLCHRLGDAVRQHLKLASLRIRHVKVGLSDRLSVLAEGKADLECGSTTNTPERRERVAFTVPHYITGIRYVVRSDSAVTQLQDFRGKSLVSTVGTSPLKAITQSNQVDLIGIRIREARDHAAAMDLVLRGEADGFAMDDVLLYGLIAARTPQPELKVVGRFLTVEPLAIALGKDDPEWKALVDGEMRRLIYSGEAKAIYDRWFLSPIPPHGMVLNIPMSYLLKDFWKYPTDKVPN